MTKTYVQAIKANNEAMERLTRPNLDNVLPILREVYADTVRVLQSFPTDTFAAYRRGQLIRQLDAIFEKVRADLPDAMNTELGSKTNRARKVGLKNLQSMMDAGSRQFAGSEIPLRLDVVRIVANAEQMAMMRYPSSAVRYAGQVGQRIRGDLIMGVVRGDSLDKIASRMAIANYKSPRDIAKKQFFSNHADAMRLVRTELNNAYNQIQVDGLNEANHDDPGWLKRWDATNDARVCQQCWRVHDEVREIHETFSCGVKAPPLHPHDRCTIVPFRRDWKL